MPRPRADRWAEAAAHLRRVDSRWEPLMERIGPCALKPRKDRFGTLVRAILGQQISTKAAASIDGRLRGLAGDPHTPDGLLAAGDAVIRSAGASVAKAKYLLNLAEHVASGRLPLARIGRWDDEQIISRLIEVKGVGRWTAEMFLIFALNRPDVLPVHDLSIRVGLRRFCGLEDNPHPRDCHALAEGWRPYRTVAMWYLWRDQEPTTPPAPAV